MTEDGSVHLNPKLKQHSVKSSGLQRKCLDDFGPAAAGGLQFAVSSPVRPYRALGLSPSIYGLRMGMFTSLLQPSPCIFIKGSRILVSHKNAKYGDY